MGRPNASRADQIEINAEFAGALEMMEGTRRHLLVTGRAGTGKSTLLGLFKKSTSKNAVVLAPTGVAAVNAGGSTVHSFFKFPPEVLAREKVKFLPEKRELLESLETLVIDEVSMVRADLMDAVDISLRQNRGRDVPFGGVQLILFGDLYQIPPVVEDPQVRDYLEDVYGGPHFFCAPAFREIDLAVVELTQVYRQSDPHFLEILDAVRKGTFTGEHLAAVNSRAGISPPEGEAVITLAARNSTVSRINLEQLKKLPGRTYVYAAEIEGQFDKKSYPTDEVLYLKEGAQVMLLTNAPHRLWVNGTLAVVEELSASSVEVSAGGVTFAVEPAVWEKVEYYYDREEKKIKSRVTGTFRQLPLKLAWAVTIHKSQGQTFDRAVIDLGGGGAFEYGQLYVALSRCRSLEGIFLKSPVRPSDIKVDPRVVEFESQLIEGKNIGRR